MTDRLGADRAVLFIVIGLALVLGAICALSASWIAMVVLVALLGAVTYAAVPAMQGVSPE